MQSPAEADQPDRFTKPIAGMLFYAVAAMIVGQSCLFTVLPPIGRQIGLAEYQIGMIMSVHGLFMLFTGPIAGSLSETWGRRRILVGGSVLYGLSIMAFGFVVEAATRGLVAVTAVLIMLITSRAVFAIGAGAVTPGAMALAADLSSRERRLHAMSLISSGFSAGAIIGPSLAAFFTGFGPSMPFYVIAAFSIGGAIAAHFVLPEPRSHKGPVVRTGISALWGKPMLIAASMTAFLLGCYGIFSILGFHFQDRFGLDTGAAARMFGFALISAAGTNVVTQTFVIRRIKASVPAMMLFGVPVTIVGFLIMGYGTTQPVMFAGMIINSFGQAFANAALATALSLSVGSSGQGRVAGMSTSAQAIGFLLGPSTSAAMYQMEMHIPFMVGVAYCMVSAAIYFFAARQKAASVE